jgi:hypothetical protein
VCWALAEFNGAQPFLKPGEFGSELALREQVLALREQVDESYGLEDALLMFGQPVSHIRPAGLAHDRLLYRQSPGNPSPLDSEAFQ